MQPDTRIVYIFSVPDFSPRQASPLQGFAPSLCLHSGLFSLLRNLPADFAEFALKDNDVRIARRIAGEGPIWWMPLSPDAIERIDLSPETPFTVVFVSPKDDASRYMAWKKKNNGLPLIVAAHGGDMLFDDLDFKALQRHCSAAVSMIHEAWAPDEYEFVEEMLADWQPAAGRKVGYTIGGHNAFAPNAEVLLRAGFDSFVEGRFDQIGEGLAPYVANIVKTTCSILDERKRIGRRDINRFNPRRPDLMLFAPSMYSALRKPIVPSAAGGQDEKQMARALTLLTTQKGYSFETTEKLLADAGIDFSEGKATVGPIFQIRQQELFLNTEVIALLAASEMSAVVRLPNEINRTAGQVRQLAEQQRSSENRDRKRTKAFREVQKRLNAAIPKEFFDIIRRSESGIRIISDAPLEWLDLDGLPLALRHETSRIPTTPGNFLISELISRPVLRLKPEAFSEVLILNALKETDPVAPFFTAALQGYDAVLRDKIRLQQVDVKSEEELIAAINSFGGAFMIFNGHGSHAPDEPAYLWLHDQKVDVWHLREKIIRMPPIVLLSACDTHAADRNHATTATGFLSIGAVTVLGTFFPIPAIDAAIFAVRLLHRVAEFIPAVIKEFDRAVTWAEVASGMFRMTLLRDYLWRLNKMGLIDEDTYKQVHKDGNLWINSQAVEPFERVINALAAFGLTESQLRSELRMAIATSTAISYVQMGRPELLVFDTQARADKQFRKMNAEISRRFDV